MAFLTDKKVLKSGLIIFRRGDVEHRNFNCRIKLPKEDRYKTISPHTSGQGELPPFIAKGKTRWQEIRDADQQAATSLDATGQAEDRTLARDVRGFLDKNPYINATPEIFAERHAGNLAATRSTPDLREPKSPVIEVGDDKSLSKASLYDDGRVVPTILH